MKKTQRDDLEPVAFQVGVVDPAGILPMGLRDVVGLAAEGLSRIESEIGRPIAQVFSVGDFGPFLNEADCELLTGPKKNCIPEDSPRIRAAWKDWRWPLSVIAGNREPFHSLRD